MKILVDECDVVRLSKNPEKERQRLARKVCRSHDIDYDKSYKKNLGKQIIHHPDGSCSYAFVTEIVNPVKLEEN